MARLRSAPVAQRSPLKEKTNTTRGAKKAPVYENDGNTEGLVKERRTGARRRKAPAQDEDELVMAGGLGSGGGAPPTTDELAKSEGALVAAVTAKRTQPRPTGKKSPDAPLAGERSGLSISPSPPPAGKLSSVKNARSSMAHPGSVMRQPSTPAVESSMLALKNFKRRPRQPSMLQIVQQHTMSARPSAVHAAQNDDPSVFNLEGDSEDDVFAPDAEGTPEQLKKTTQPVAAKTSITKPQKATTQPSQAAAPTKKRKSGEGNVSSSSLGALRAKRRKSELVAATSEDALIGQPNIARTNPESSSARQTTPPRQLTSDDVLVINSSSSHPSSTPPTEPSSSDQDRTREADPEIAIPSTEEDELNQQAELEPTYDAPNGTMAEPDACSPEPSPERRPRRITNDLTEPATQADPLTQVSPSPQKPVERKKQKPMSTKTLQSLLPKRRQPLKPRHRKSEYDITSDSEGDDDRVAIDTSHLEEDEDELSGRLPRQTKKAVTSAPTKGRKSTTAKSTAKGKARQSKAAQQTTRKSTAPPATKKPTKTYGRAANTASDKENDLYESVDEEDTTDLPGEAQPDIIHSKELEEAKRKFEEIDKWDMEFESMSVEDHRSSSQGWR
jgi:hypothetical protein